MRKLLSADFARLCKNKFLLFSLIGFFLGALYLLDIHIFDSAYPKPIETLFFFFMIPLGVMLAVFCGLLLGTDYSDGTLRNKIIVGHSRTAVYFSNLLSVTFAGLLMSVAFLLPVCCLGLPATSGFLLTQKELLMYLLDAALVICSLSAVFTMVCMLCPRKTTAVIVCLLGTVALYVLCAWLYGVLSEPEFYEELVSFDPSTEEVIYSQFPNDDYVGGTRREIYTFLVDLLPTGQAYQLALCSAEHLVGMAACSAGFATVTTVIGLFGFRKKDLK